MALPREFTDLAREVNNWGRWGDDDELGTLNLITPDVVVRAAECVKRGESFPLGLPLHAEGPQTGVMPGRINPIHLMTQVNQRYGKEPESFHASDDAVVMGLQCATHWDAFSHVSYDGRLYNGVDADVITAGGATRLSIRQGQDAGEPWRAPRHRACKGRRPARAGVLHHAAPTSMLLPIRPG